ESAQARAPNKRSHMSPVFYVREHLMMRMRDGVIECLAVGASGIRPIRGNRRRPRTFGMKCHGGPVFEGRRETNRVPSNKLGSRIKFSIELAGYLRAYGKLASINRHAGYLPTPHPGV